MNQGKRSFIAPFDVAIGAGSAAWYAMPDAVESRWSRGAIKTILMLGVGGYLARLDGPEVEHGDPASLVGVSPVSAEAVLTGSPDVAGRPPTGRVAVVASAGVLASLAGLYIGDRAMARSADWLRARGVRRPYTVLGIGIGVATALTRPSRSLRV